MDFAIPTSFFTFVSDDVNHVYVLCFCNIDGAVYYTVCIIYIRHAHQHAMGPGQGR